MARCLGEESGALEDTGRRRTAFLHQELAQGRAVMVAAEPKAVRGEIERLTELGIDPSSMKTSSVGLGQYEFTKGVEVRGRTLNEILVIYQIWISKDRPPINMDLIKSINETLRSRPKSKWVPMIMIDEEPEDYLNLVRQVRRLIKRGQSIVKAVSNGQFPGKSRLS